MHGRDQITTEPYLHLRYQGTDCALMCTTARDNSEIPNVMKHGDFESVFINRLHSSYYVEINVSKHVHLFLMIFYFVVVGSVAVMC